MTNLPAPSDILSGDVTTIDDISPSEMYAMTIALAYEINQAADNAPRAEFIKVLNIATTVVLENFEADFVFLFLRAVLRTNEQGESQFNLRTDLNERNKTLFHDNFLGIIKNIPSDDNDYFKKLEERLTFSYDIHKDS